MVRARILWIATGLLVVSCAIPEPPPGGPEDKTPPEVVATRPAAGSPGVPTDVRIEIEFSEKMSPVRFERSIELWPPAKVSKARWKKNAVSIELEEPLRSDTTYVVRIKGGYADAHNVRNERAFEFAFATSAALDTGSVSGTVYFRRKPSEKGVVRLFVLPKDSSFAPAAARPDREAFAQRDGSYEFRYLPTRGASFLVWAFHDANGNGIFDRDSEAGAVGDTLVLTQVSPRLALVDIRIVDPREPASIGGVVVNATRWDSLRVSVALHERADSTPPTYFTVADSSGRYSFKSVLHGTYTLRAFVDLERDSLCGAFVCPDDSATVCPEPCATYPDTLRVSPGDEIRLGTLRVEEAQRAKER